ncbi:MAG: hypothetical protein J0L73_08620, partial [Verrucomicrobia bacterium]|nr:hypothetical protein [Verrucomicrobiota bacterium]
ALVCRDALGSLLGHVGGVFRVLSTLPSYHRSASVTPPTWYLPDTYGFKAEDLAEVMNQMKQLERLESGALMF